MLKHISKLLILSTCMFSPAIARAGILNAEEAKEVGSGFFRSGNINRLADTGSLTLEHTETSGSKPVYYVFNAKDGDGFIIVSADDTAIPVIGYSTTSSWKLKSTPEETMQLIDRAALSVRNNMTVMRAPSANSDTKVLTTATWSQEAPFNNKIPNRRLAGCVGTALAEILKYHQYPVSRPLPLLKDGDTESYDWENMRDDNYRDGYSFDEAEAVSTLVADAALAIGTDFGMSTSSAFEVKVPAALINMFGYDAGVSYKKGSELDRESWDALIVNEIDEGRPVLYSGQDISAGHAFVCDGYQMMGQTPYFHINWGWGGAADGFYASDALNPTVSSSHSFNNLTTVVYNIKPATTPGEWSPIHITSDEKQIGMTIDVTDLTPGITFTVRAGALKNISNDNFSGNVSVALYTSNGDFKQILADGKSLNIGSLQIIGYTDLKCTVPDNAIIDDGDVVRLVTRENGSTVWIPVANDLMTTGHAQAKGYTLPYFNINLPAIGNDVSIMCDDPKVIKGRDFTFQVIPASPDNVVTVKANGYILSPDESWNYRINNVNCEQDIDIIVQNAEDVVSKRNLWVQAGQLSQLISDVDAGTISDLTLYGTINAEDFSFIRERMKLSRLDLSGVSILASGANPANAIPAKAFNEYTSLRQIILPKNLNTLKNGCFRKSGLESIEIPASVSTFEYNIFVGCSRLKEVIVRRSTPAWINWCVFNGTPKARLVVPVGAAAAYNSKEYWQDFSDIVEENPVPATHYNVIVQDMNGVKFNHITESTQIIPGAQYEFSVETDESYGDATMEVYANNTRIYADQSGIYRTVINANTLIHANFRQPEVAGESSPWKITAGAGGVGLVTDIINVGAGKSFSLRANALAIPSDNAALFYCAALTDKDGRIKELISPVIANNSGNSGNLPCNFTCMVKDASVREGNFIRIVTSYDKKRWSLVNADCDSISDRISAIGNRVVYHDINMPQKVEGAVIQGAASQIVRGMPLNLKVTPVSVDDRITIAVNGINKIVDSAVANLSIPAVVEDLEISIQVVPKGADSYTVVNVREGELASKIEQCPSRLKVTGVMRSEDFDAFRSHAADISSLDLADVSIKGVGDLDKAIPANAFASSDATVSSRLTSIILPTNLVNIEANAFNRCLNLKEVTLPASVSYVGSNAFSSCIGLNKIIVAGNQPPATGSMNPFPAQEVKLEVPAGSENAYSSATFWKDLSMSTSIVYYNIQIDQDRIFNYNPYYTLTKIQHPTASKLQVTLGLPNFKPTSYKDNPAYRPGVAFKLFDNSVDKTYSSSFLKYGQHSVVFDPTVTDPKFSSCPQNHVIDIVFFYHINFNKPENIEAEFVNLADDEIWNNVDYWLFVPDSELKPTLYREGRDFRFKLRSEASNVELKVTAKSNIITKPGDNPVYETMEQVIVADENGVYTLPNLQGDTDISVNTSLIVEDGSIISSDDLKLVDDSDADNITDIGVSGSIDEEAIKVIREQFHSLETLNLSEIDNESIPDNAFEGMKNLKSVTIPDNVTSIGKNSFAGCTSLESVTLPGVSYIGEGAFEGCSSMTSISILGQNYGNGSEAPVRMNAPVVSGLNDDSFRGLNPNCLIFLPEGADKDVVSTPNVIINKNGSRVARGDISLNGQYPFNSPAGFSLADNRISMSVDIPGSTADIDEGWKGLILPFSPSGYEIDKEFSPRSENVLSLLSFDDETSGMLSSQKEILANRPYLANVHAPFDTVPVTFFTDGKSSHGEIVYDIPFTPSPEDVSAKGKTFTLFGNYNTSQTNSGIFLLDNVGKTFRPAESDTVIMPFSTYLRINEAGTESAFNVGEHPVWVFDPTPSRASGEKLYRSSTIGLTSASKDATIYYTTDGSDPTRAGIPYSGPISPDDEIMTIKAVAVFKGNCSDTVRLEYELRKTNLEYTLKEGWNWISHNVEKSLPLADIMGVGIDRVLSQTQEVIRDPELGLIGTLDSINPLEAYKVFSSGNNENPFVSGVSFDPSTPVSLSKGWNWIGCPVEEGNLTLDSLFANLPAVEGDMIVGREGFASVNAGGEWIGDLRRLTPGEGYMFLSTEEQTFVYNVTESADTTSAIKHVRGISDAPWVADSRRYPSVMPVISRITNEGYETANDGEFEIGAFCGDECRGVGVIVDDYVMISVYGNPGDEISFRVLSTSDNSESLLRHTMRFEDYPVGSLKEPYLFDVSETTALAAVNDDLYVISSENGNLSVTANSSSVLKIEIYDVAGMKIAGGSSSVKAERLGEGVYIVVLHTDRGSVSHRLAIK